MKYTGNLAKRISQSKLGLLATDEDVQAGERRIMFERLCKLPELFEAHGVKPGLRVEDFLALTLALAAVYVPGFKVSATRGRKTEWSVADRASFRLDVDAVIECSGLSVVEAIKRTIRLDAWKKKTKPMTISALEKHYYAADSVWVNVVRDARAYESIALGN